MADFASTPVAEISNTDDYKLQVEEPLQSTVKMTIEEEECLNGIHYSEEEKLSEPEEKDESPKESFSPVEAPTTEETPATAREATETVEEEPEKKKKPNIIKRLSQKGLKKLRKPKVLEEAADPAEGEPVEEVATPAKKEEEERVTVTLEALADPVIAIVEEEVSVEPKPAKTHPFFGDNLRILCKSFGRGDTKKKKPVNAEDAFPKDITPTTPEESPATFEAEEVKEKADNESTEKEAAEENSKARKSFLSLFKRKPKSGEEKTATEVEEEEAPVEAPEETPEIGTPPDQREEAPAAEVEEEEAKTDEQEEAKTEESEEKVKRETFVSRLKNSFKHSKRPKVVKRETLETEENAATEGTTPKKQLLQIDVDNKEAAELITDNKEADEAKTEEKKKKKNNIFRKQKKEKKEDNVVDNNKATTGVEVGA